MSTSSPLPHDGAAQVPVPVAVQTATAPASGVSRSDRAADALISSYLRELLADDDAARGRSADT